MPKKARTIATQRAKTTSGHGSRPLSKAPRTLQCSGAEVSTALWQASSPKHQMHKMHKRTKCTNKCKFKFEFHHTGTARSHQRPQRLSRHPGSFVPQNLSRSTLVWAFRYVLSRSAVISHRIDVWSILVVLSTTTGGWHPDQTIDVHQIWIWIWSGAT